MLSVGKIMVFYMSPEIHQISRQNNVKCSLKSRKFEVVLLVIKNNIDVTICVQNCTLYNGLFFDLLSFSLIVSQLLVLLFIYKIMVNDKTEM
jgi:hypothetical protein